MSRVRTNVYVERNLKMRAKKIFKKYGLTFSDAINIFLAQVVHKKGIPFSIELPNDVTLKTIEDSRKGINMEEITIEDLKEDRTKPLGEIMALRLKEKLSVKVV